MFKITKKDLLIDLQKAAQAVSILTRNHYREVANYPESSWQKYFATFEDFCDAAGVNMPPLTSEIQGDDWSVNFPSTELCTAEAVIKYCKVDLNAWSLERFRAKDISKVGGEARFQISAFFKKRKDVLAILHEIEDLKALAKASIHRKPEKIKRATALSGNMLEIAIPDLHIGKLAWSTETGHEPCDVQIMEVMFNRALDTLIERSKSFAWDRVLFTVGNDLLNSDNVDSKTTKGTVVTTDARYHKTFWKTRNMIVAAIEKLRKIAPVTVLVCPGNHDRLASFHLGDSLECYFHSDSDVTVENAPCPRKYVEWGKVMLMFCHGDEGKRDDYAMLMATERPEMFGRTKFREVHTGHTHQTKLDEKHGIRVRVIPSLSPPDDWHSSNGFVGNLRSAEAYFWNETQGLVGTAIYNDDSQPTIITKRMVVSS